MGLRWFCCRDSLFTVLLCYLMCSDVFFCKAADPLNVYEKNSDSLSERIITIKMPGTRPLKASTHHIFTSLDDIKLTCCHVFVSIILIQLGNFLPVSVTMC